MSIDSKVNFPSAQELHERRLAMLNGGTIKRHAKLLVEHGYDLMRDNWRPEGIPRVNGNPNPRMSVALLSFYPTREYDGLIDVPLDEAGGYRVNLRLPEITLVETVRVALLPTKGSKKLIRGDGFPSRSKVNIVALYLAQENLRDYEKGLDKKTVKAIMDRIRSKGVPADVAEFEELFADSFREAIDAQGGIDFFRDRHKAVYDMWNDARGYDERVNHFEVVSKRKMGIYRAAKS